MDAHDCKTLAEALVYAQSIANAVGKDSTNSFHKYAYASAEAILEEARNALNGAGLAVAVFDWEILPAVNGTEPRIRAKFSLLHTSGQERIGTADYFIVPDKGRPPDKATASALTTLEAYYLRGLLCLPRVKAGEDRDSHDDRHYEPPARTPQPPEPPAPKTPRGTVEQEVEADELMRKLGILKNKAEYLSSIGAANWTDLPRNTADSWLERLRLRWAAKQAAEKEAVAEGVDRHGMLIDGELARLGKHTTLEALGTAAAAARDAETSCMVAEVPAARRRCIQAAIVVGWTKLALKLCRTKKDFETVAGQLQEKAVAAVLTEQDQDQIRSMWRELESGVGA